MIDNPEALEPAVLTKPIIAIVDDDEEMRALLSIWLQKAGFETREFAHAEVFLQHVESEVLDVVILDLVMPTLDGIATLKLLHERKIGVSVVILTASNQAQDAFQAVKLGAYDYLVKPVEKERLIASINNAVERNQLLQKVQRFEHEIQEKYTFQNIIGSSAAMEKVFQSVKKVSNSSIPIYLFGESGTGKELIAKAIHYSSPRKSEPFIALNCAAIPENLRESEFFGHEKGAFTGATSTRKGSFEQAHKGTLFLDEVGEMDLSTQVKLLRVLQEQTVTRIGATKSVQVDVRILCATNKNLKELVESGLFREDLYYRLTGYMIHLPPLRNRVEDIPLLIQFFLKKYREESSLNIKGFSPTAMDALCHYSWPGNVRELENVVHSMVVTAEDEWVPETHLPTHILQYEAEHFSRSMSLMTLSSFPSMERSSVSLGAIPAVEAEIIPLKELEKQAILGALRITGGKVDEAAKKLGIGRATLYRKLSQYEGEDGGV